MTETTKRFYKFCPKDQPDKTDQTGYWSYAESREEAKRRITEMLIDQFGSVLWDFSNADVEEYVDPHEACDAAKGNLLFRMPENAALAVLHDWHHVVLKESTSGGFSSKFEMNLEQFDWHMQYKLFR